MATPAEQSTPSRSWRVIVIVLAVVAVVGGAVYFLLRGGDGGHHLGTGATPGSNTPSFHFRHGAGKAIATAATGKIDQGAVATATDDISTTLTNMYALAFLDPGHWKKNDYDVVFGFFAGGKPAASAKGDEATLTLGPDAGNTFDDVQPKRGTLGIRVLTDRGGKPVSSAATADFLADATNKDGSTMLIESRATYYMQPTKKGWVIFGYRAIRKDRAGGAAPVPSSGATS